LSIPAAQRAAKYALPGHRGVFHIGSAVPLRANAMSQMIRACDFTHAFTKSLGSGGLRNASIVVVGGGVTGVSVAYNLLLAGAKVAIVEREPYLIPKFKDAVHRYIHPGIFDWPMYIWERPNAQATYDFNKVEYPRIEWTADTAPNVREQILKAFEQVSASPNYSQFLQTNVIDFHVAGGAVYVNIQQLEPLICDYLVICPGLGEEVLSTANTSYWNLNAPTSDHLIIAGAGDGAVIDAIKYLLKENREEVLYQKLVTDWDRGERVKVESAVSEYVNFRKLAVTPHQHAQNINGLLEHLPKTIAPLVHSRRRVTFVCKDQEFYSDRITQINLVLFLAIAKCAKDRVHWVRGSFDLKTVKIKSDSFLDVQELNKSIQKKRADLVVRIGPSREVFGLAGAAQMYRYQLTPSDGDPIYMKV
jgi:hypothetical protein